MINISTMVLDSKGKLREENFSEILSDSSERIRERGISFRLTNNDDGEKVWKFLMEEFMPDEPVYR